MNTFKKFLVLGSTLINISIYNIEKVEANSMNIVDENSINTINRSYMVRGGCEYTNGDYVINHPYVVSNSRYDSTKENSKLAELRVGQAEDKRKSDYSTMKMILDNNAILIQTNTGHIHIFDKLIVRDGAMVLTSPYNVDHIEGNSEFIDGKLITATSIKDSDLSKLFTAGFDIHGDRNHNGGSIIFEDGSKVGTYFNNKKYEKLVAYYDKYSTVNSNSEIVSQNGITRTGNAASAFNITCGCCACCCCVTTHHGAGGSSGCHHHTSGDIATGGGTTGDGTTGGNTPTGGGATGGDTTGGSGTEYNTENNLATFYLCNNAFADIAQLVPKIGLNKKTDETNLMIVGTRDKNNTILGSVNIFTSSDDFLNGNSYDYTTQINNMGNNNVILYNVKMNTPAYNIIITDGEDETGKKIASEDKQNMRITTLEKTKSNTGSTTGGTTDGSTEEAKDEVGGEQIQVAETNENGEMQSTILFTDGNLIDTLKDKHLLNKPEDDKYTYLVTKDKKETGIKIAPKLNNLNNISEVFSNDSTLSTEIETDYSNFDNRISVLEFVKSIKPTGEETEEDKKLKVRVYKKNSDNEYKYYDIYLNNENYNLNLDKFYKYNGHVAPFIDAVPDINTYMQLPIKLTTLDMRSLVNYKTGDVPNSILPIYINLTGELRNVWILPHDENNNNQILEIDLFGNNTNFTNYIFLEELASNAYDYLRKLVFAKNSFVKTNRTNENKDNPMIWEFTGSNKNVNQDDSLYASNIDTSLALFAINNKYNETNMQVELNNPNLNKDKYSTKLSYLYTDELFFTKNGIVQSDTDFDSSLVCNDRSVLSFVNRTNRYNKFPFVIFTIAHMDNNNYNIKYNAESDGELWYRPATQFFHAKDPLIEQIQRINSDEVIFHTLLPKFETEELQSNGQTTNTQYLDICVIKDPKTNKNKLRFYSMVEYVYDTKYDNEYNTPLAEYEKMQHNLDFTNSNSHLYIPLRALPAFGQTRYFLTDTNIFDGYSKKKLINNYKNALKDNIEKTTIIPNIYLGNNKIATSELSPDMLNDILNDSSTSPYLVYYKNN